MLAVAATNSKLGEKITFSGRAVKMQYCGGGSTHDLSSMPTDPGSQLEVDSAFCPSGVGKLNTPLCWGGSKV